jgi:hypothetical protein
MVPNFSARNAPKQDGFVSPYQNFLYGLNPSLGLGTGENSLTVSGAATGLTLTAGTGDDTVSLAGVTGSTIVNLGTGENSLTVSGAAAGLTVTSGASGSTLVSLKDVDAGTLTLGAADDTVSIEGAVTGTLSTVNLGNGENSLTISGDLTVGVDIDGGAGVDTVHLKGTAADADPPIPAITLGGTITIDTAAGNDAVTLDGKLTIAADAAIAVNLGEGDDVLTLDAEHLTLPTFSTGTGFTLNGGADGNDTLALKGGTFDRATGGSLENKFSFNGFETIDLTGGGELKTDISALETNGITLGADITLVGGTTVADSAGKKAVWIEGGADAGLTLASYGVSGIVFEGAHAENGKIWNVYSYKDSTDATASYILARQGAFVYKSDGASLADGLTLVTTAAAVTGDFTSRHGVLTELLGSSASVNKIDSSSLALLSGTGANTLTVGGNVTGSTLIGADGDDTLIVTGALTSSEIHLGGGDNSLSVTGATSGLLLTGGDGDNTLAFTGGILNSSLILGDGADAVTVGATTVDTAATLNAALGGGNDTLTLGLLTTNAALSGLLNAGAGTDTLKLDSGAGGAFSFGVGSTTTEDFTFEGFEKIDLTNSQADTLTLDSVLMDVDAVNGELLEHDLFLESGGAAPKVAAGSHVTWIKGDATDTLKLNGAVVESSVVGVYKDIADGNYEYDVRSYTIGGEVSYALVTKGLSVTEA